MTRLRYNLSNLEKSLGLREPSGIMVFLFKILDNTSSPRLEQSIKKLKTIQGLSS